MAKTVFFTTEDWEDTEGGRFSHAALKRFAAAVEV